MHYSKPTYTKMELPTQKLKKRQSKQIILKTCLVVFTLFCILPVLLVFIASFSSETSIQTRGFSFFPAQWSLDAYKYIGTFGQQLVRSYVVSIYEAIVGTFITLLFTSMFGYVLTRNGFCMKKPLTYFLIITMFVNCGPLAGYVVNTNIYHLRNNLLVLVLPGCVGVFNVVMMRTFIQSNVPDGLVEAAKIDGAGECYTFFRIVLPLIKPILAAVGFMCAVGHWNQWQTSMLYIDDPDYATLQYMLMQIENNIKFLTENATKLSAEQLQMWDEIPNTSSRMATLLCTVLPVMVIYPFFQKNFVKGMTIGSIKG